LDSQLLPPPLVVYRGRDSTPADIRSALCRPVRAKFHNLLPLARCLQRLLPQVSHLTAIRVAATQQDCSFPNPPNPAGDTPCPNTSFNQSCSSAWHLFCCRSRPVPRKSSRRLRTGK